jgi:hypothetical protein
MDTLNRDMRTTVASLISLRDKKALMQVSKTWYWTVKALIRIQVIPWITGALKLGYCKACPLRIPNHNVLLNKIHLPMWGRENYIECEYGHRTFCHVLDMNGGCKECPTCAAPIIIEHQKKKRRIKE